jgi:uncharacterized membrane protein YccC
MRHALRVALSTGSVLLLAKLLQLQHAYWASHTCLVVMQPHGSATFAKALQRVGGTLLGAALAILVASLVHDPPARLALIFVFAAVSVALLPLNYGAYAVFLTPSFVLLAELGVREELASVRVLNTLIGASIALVGSRLLFPIAERDQFPSLMATALRRARDLLLAIAAKDAAGALRQARSRAGRALQNAEASFQRLLTEGRSSAEAHEAIASLLLHSHRVLSGLNALAAEGSAAFTDSSANVHAFADPLERLACAIDAQRAPEPIARSPATRHARLERLAGEFTLQRGAAARWLSIPT